MRIDDSEERVKVWLTDTEDEQLERAAGDRDWKREVAVKLMSRCGLRAHEVPRVRPVDVQRTEDGEHYLLRARGKNTKGGEPKTRRTWLPDNFERELHRFKRERDIDRSEPFVDSSTRTVRRWVERAADACLEETGDPDWEHVSSHDLRRRWAQRLLVDERVNPRVVMSLGGWSSFQAIQPYLNAPSESVIVDEMADISI